MGHFGPWIQIQVLISVFELTRSLILKKKTRLLDPDPNIVNFLVFHQSLE